MERGGPWRSLSLPSCMASQASLPSSWADRFSPTISLLCLQSPSLGRERGVKKVPSRAPGPSRFPSSCLPHILCIHRACCSSLTPVLAQAAPPTTCSSPLASPPDGVLVPGSPAPSLPLPPSPSCSPAPLEGRTFLVMVPFCSVSPGLRTLPHHQGPCLFSAAPPVQGLWTPSSLLGAAWPKYEGWDPLWGHETSSLSVTQHNPSSPC